MNSLRVRTLPIPLVFIGLCAFLFAPAAIGQINNDIFSLTPKHYYRFVGQKETRNEVLKTTQDTFTNKPFDSTYNQEVLTPEMPEFVEDDQGMRPTKYQPHWGFLHYNKDNEYLQRINPGETFFGNQLWAFNTFALGHSDDFK